MIRGSEVLELATGPGMLAKHIAPAAKKIIATDYSEGMIREAEKGYNPPNLTFETADAMALPYGDNSFDVVIIANALHIVPDPEKVLSEIDRVLRPGGILIAPNFVEHKGTALSRLWSGILRIAGVRFETEDLSIPNYQGNAVVNYTDAETPYTRIIEHKHFEMFGQQVYDVPHTVISREFSSEWKPGMEPYYPVNDDRNNTLYAKYAELAQHQDNVVFGGRLAEYKYYDMDQIILRALHTEL